LLNTVRLHTAHQFVLKKSVCTYSLLPDTFPNLLVLTCLGLLQHFRTYCYRANQAQSEYKHSLTFRVWRYVVIATKPVQRLQMRHTVHN